MQWQDKSTAFIRQRSDLTQTDHTVYGDPLCGLVRRGSSSSGLKLEHQLCETRRLAHPFCEFDPTLVQNTSDRPRSVIVEKEAVNSSSMVICLAGHVVHNFLACDLLSHCWVGRGQGQGQGQGSCESAVDTPPPSFTCGHHVQRVPYTLVCDHRPDCSDGSDEDLCVFPPCVPHVTFDCGGSECVPASQACDNIVQCASAHDETACPPRFAGWYPSYMDSRAIVHLSEYYGNGLRAYPTRGTGASCPATHFMCPSGQHLCLPVFLRCNGLVDCPGHEDEAGCDGHAPCPGYYRCRQSQVCVHPDHLCDRYEHCPQHDDELLCGFQCPRGCTCFGMAFYCKHTFPAGEYPDLRYLNARGSNVSVEDLDNNTMLTYLNLAHCSLSTFRAPRLLNLWTLDISDNRVVHLQPDSLKALENLRVVRVAGNPLIVSLAVAALAALTKLRVLDLSRVSVPALDPGALATLPHLHTLNLSASGLDHVRGSGFRTLRSLRTLDLSLCPVAQFPRGVFDNLLSLRAVTTSNYKLCCPAVLPQLFHPDWCSAPSDDISSCEDLLRSTFYRVALSLLATFALVGNVVSFLYRVLLDKRTRSLGFGVFVVHLCVSDFLMGVYLLVIGLADRLYKDDYVWRDLQWKHSAACRCAGFLSLLSSEVSAFLICIITTDRFLVLRFPFSQFRFGRRSAQLASCSAWAVGIIVAVIPLIPATSHWSFFSQTGICIPLPITRTDFPGRHYSFGVWIGLNLALFVFIAAGQCFIYWSVSRNAMSGAARGCGGRTAKDLVIARRLMTVAVSDFLCWFPIGVLGVLAARHVPVPGEVNVAMAILVLPLNSALNPFLYTVNVIVERRRRLKDDRLLAVLSQVQAANQ